MDAVAVHRDVPVVVLVDIPEGLLGPSLVDTRTPTGLAVDFEARVLAGIERAYLRQKPRHTYGIHNTSTEGKAYEMLTGVVVP